MNEEIKKQAEELTDEEVQGAAGGYNGEPRLINCKGCHRIYGVPYNTEHKVDPCPMCGYAGNSW